MSENCNHDCGSCSANCSERKAPLNAKAPLHPEASVKHVIGVVSGKGGVGKSLVTAMLASLMQRRGYQAAILDADVTGPSIPRAFGIRERAYGGVDCVYPVRSGQGVEVMSMNLLLNQDTDPVIWRGPMIAGTVRQLWSEVLWENVDYLFVDMPPGTGDVPLTVFQSLPVEGVVVVSTPQSLVGMIVEKAIRMADEMNIPVLGLVENMSYYRCPDCGAEHSIFGQSHMEDTALVHGIPVTVRLPIDPAVAAACDEGRIESVDVSELGKLADFIESIAAQKE